MQATMKPGERHWRLVSVDHIKDRKGQFWKFKCDCGNEHIAAAKDVRSGNTQSCGCLKYENSKRQNRRTHGKSFSSEHRTWTNIKTRCYNVNHDDYPRYGGRGITVCERWLNSFDAFFEDMGPRPSSNHSIDRIDNDRGYEPGNCRWATMKEQSNNRGNSHFVIVDGAKLSLPDAALVLGIKYQTLFWRVKTGRPIDAPVGRWP